MDHSNDGKKGAIVQYIRLKSSLSEIEVLKAAREREGMFKAIPGLLQKYYVKGKNEGEYGGIYIWDSQESLNEYRNSSLAATIPEAYKLLEPPKIEVLDMLFKLRD